MDPPSILWITLESTRADHCSLYGYDRETTPELSRLAAKPGSVAFSDCHAHGIWTRSSSASILTGTYPTHHRVGLDTDTQLPDQIDTVPELLKRAGYDTSCVSPNPNLSTASGLARGFDEFSYLSKSTLIEESTLGELAKYLLGFRRHTGGLRLDPRKHPFGYVCNQIAKRQIDTCFGGSAPGFVYLHYPDTHHPYYPPKAYRDRFSDGLSISGDEAAEVAFDVFEDLYHHIATGCELTDRQWASIVSMYDSMIRYTDDLAASIIDYASDRVEGPLAVVVTSDHGELLGERDLLSHRFVTHSALTHVPLVLDYPEISLETSGLVQHSDIVKTLLRVAGADASQIDGYDLRTERRPYAVTQRGGERAAGMLEELDDRKGSFDSESYVRGDVTCVIDGTYRYEVSPESDREAVYELESERKRANDDAAADRLREWYTSFMQSSGQPVTDEVQSGELTPEMDRHMKDLGYL